MSAIPTKFLRTEQPLDTDFRLADGIFVKQIAIANAGVYIPQHSHEYEHVTMLARGSIRVWIDGVLDARSPLGTYTAPCPIVIAAKAKHLFKTLERDTLLFCIHNIARTGEVEVAEEHQLVKET